MKLTSTIILIVSGLAIAIFLFMPIFLVRRWRPRLSVILAVFILGISVSPLVGGWLYLYQSGTEAARSLAMTSAERMSVLSINTIDRALYFESQIIKAAALGIFPAMLADKSVRPQLSALIESPDFFNFVGAYQNDGVLRDDIGVGAPHVIDINAEWFAVAGRGEVFVSDVQIDNGAAHIIVSAPIKEPNGPVIGVLAADIDPARLVGVMPDQNEFTPFLIDAEGHFLGGDAVATSNRAVTLLSPNQRALLNKVSTTPAAFYDNEFGLTFVSVARSQGYRTFRGNNLAVMAMVPKSQAVTDVINRHRRAAIFYALLFVILPFVLYAAIRRLLEPIEDLREVLGGARYGHLGRHFEYRGIREFERLAAAYNEMTDELAESSARLEAEVKRRTKVLDREVLNLERAKEHLTEANLSLTEQKSAVAIERANLQAVINSMSEGLVIIDREEIIRLMNPVAMQIIGLLGKKVLGKSHQRWINIFKEGEPPVPYDCCSDVFKTGQTTMLPSRALVKRSDGRMISVAGAASPIKDAANRVVGVVLVFRDAREERKLEQMKSDFVAIAAHQLRTPLSAVKWFLEMVVKGESGKITEETKDFVTQAYNSNERLIALVNDLLNVSRIEAGRLNIEPVVTDVAKLISEVGREYNMLINAKNLSLKMDFDKKAEKISVDPKVIRQVVTNLVSNAIKYTNGGGTITIATRVRKPFLVVSVRDTGVGIPEKEKNRVFDKFFRASNVARLETEGTGLGLYVARSAVEASGGRLWFVSEEGKGSTFSFSLPLGGSPRQGGDKKLEEVRI
ncbi:MAG: PAS/PAC sensor signal transduction histidine kinase [Candidatus Magasanikbacteria bacterium]|nr:PAS/PAC sensor signal transduction histidine kinase [Candidatus Magasanikbacteria bacterium]